MSSATDVKEKERAKTKGKEKEAAAKPPRPNPVALEVPVSVTWAKPAQTDEKRELFTEETVTVLVFKDGAVIQLASAITTGQLVFLTSKKTNREVVCQVVQKRAFRPTSCYVELEFTEDAGDFWGVAFPIGDEAAEVPAIAEAVAAQAPTEEEASVPVAAPKSEEVAQLKDEVQALRKQLQELKEKQPAEEKPAEEEKKASEEKDEVARRLDEAEAAARRAAEKEAVARKAAEAEKAAQREAEENLYDTQPAEEMEALAKQLAQAEAAARRAAEEEAAGRAEGKRNSSAQETPVQAEPEPTYYSGKTETQGPLEASAPPPEPKAEQQLVAASEAPAEDSLRTAPETAAEPVRESNPEPEAIRPKIAMKLPSMGASLDTPAPPTEAPSLPPPTARPAGLPPHEDDGLDELLPKPALDFSKAKTADPNDPYNIYRLPPKPPGIQEKLVAVGLALVLIAIVGVSWYENWLPFFHRTPNASTAAKSGQPAAPGDAASGASESSATNASAPSASSKRAASSVPASKSAGAVAPAAGDATTSTGNSADTSSPDTEIDATAAAGSGKRNAASGKPEVAKISRNRGKAETSTESKTQQVAEIVDSTAPVIPPKLVKSANPVYPPDAMRQYITGDVRIEAFVDAKGHVGTMNVILGPQAFRQAAMDALRQYEYEPATQGGKPVASKVVVTVKFWFDP